MPELINKQSTNPSDRTVNRKTLQFSNPAIDKYLPTFGSLGHKSIPFKVPLRSHLTSWLLIKDRYNNDKTECPRGEIGRQKGLKMYQSVKIRKIKNKKYYWVKAIL